MWEYSAICHPPLQVYKPVDFLHLYNKNPLFNSAYVATGDSGQGMTGGTLAGLIISDLILGKLNRWAEIYNTHRLPPLAAVVAKAEAEIVAHTAEVGRGMGGFYYPGVGM